MNIIALLAVRNESLYLNTCISHLVEQGISIVVIDNDSTDQTVEIAQSWLGKGVVGIERYPYQGFYDWQGILDFKIHIAKAYPADWYIHHDADEIRQSANEHETLHDAICRLDALGYNAIDFLEFVYTPTSVEQRFEGTDYRNSMHYAYYFQPNPLHRVNAWKSGFDVNISRTGGHRAEFNGRVLAEEKLILRHYPLLSWQHLAEKYIVQRVYSRQEVEEKGWHGKRAYFSLAEAWLPKAYELVCPAIEGWDISQPRTSHPFLGGKW